jgi:hypothetical protein
LQSYLSLSQSNLANAWCACAEIVATPTTKLARTSPLVVIAVSPQSPYWDKLRRLARVSVPFKPDGKLKATRLSDPGEGTFSTFWIDPDGMGGRHTYSIDRGQS